MYGLSSLMQDDALAFRQAVENGNWWDAAVLLGKLHIGYTKMADILRTLHPAAHENFVNLLIENLNQYLEEQKALRAGGPEQSASERGLDNAEKANAGRVADKPPTRRK